MPQGRIGPVSAKAVVIAGERVLLDPAGALWWPRRETLAIADLHLEKATSLARHGHFLPPYDSAATLAVLAELIARYRPRRVIALGDSFHDSDGPARLSAPDRHVLDRLCGDRQWIWITGNHDPDLPRNLPGCRREEISLAPFVFRHRPRARPARGEIAGHLHPCARLRTGGRNFRRRCFATDGERLILPALGALSGGLNVLDPAFDGLFGDRFLVWITGAGTLHPIAPRSLSPD